MKDEHSVDYSIPKNEVSFLKGMIREYYQPEIKRLKKILEGYKKECYGVNNYAFKLHSIIKEVREYIEEKEKNNDNWIDYELLIEPIKIKEILEKEDK